MERGLYTAAAPDLAILATLADDSGLPAKSAVQTSDLSTVDVPSVD